MRRLEDAYLRELSEQLIVKHIADSVIIRMRLAVRARFIHNHLSIGVVHVRIEEMKQRSHVID